MTYAQLRFNQLSDHDQNILLEFLENLTDGEIRNICKGQQMDKRDTIEICEAWDRFVYEQE